MKEVGKETILTLATAHALVKLDDGTIVGDPMEKTTLDAMEWTVGNGEQEIPLPGFSRRLPKFCRRLNHPLEE